jgi:hypothetical protein
MLGANFMRLLDYMLLLVGWYWSFGIDRLVTLCGRRIGLVGRGMRLVRSLGFLLVWGRSRRRRYNRFGIDRLMTLCGRRIGLVGRGMRLVCSCGLLLFWWRSRRRYSRGFRLRLRLSDLLSMWWNPFSRKWSNAGIFQMLADNIFGLIFYGHIEHSFLN